MKLKEVCLEVAVFAFLATMTISLPKVRALSYIPGVKAGDWIKYGQISITWTGTGAEPSYVIETKKADWVKIQIENVEGTVITLNETVHYSNGTQTFPSSSRLDLNGNVGMSSRFIIAANLKGGDPIATPSNSPTINQTTTGNYAASSRNVNLFSATAIEGNQTTTLTAYYDQSTGIMVEMHMKRPDPADSTNPTGTVEISMKATETNMWQADLLGTISNNLVYIISATVTIIAVTSAALILRKKKRSSLPPPAKANRVSTAFAARAKYAGVRKFRVQFQARPTIRIHSARYSNLPVATRVAFPPT